MPYRHAHWFLLSLFPLAGVAFWPGYVGRLADSPAAFHVHGITASLWLALVAFQSWSIHHRRNAWHRTAGLGSFALFPFFIAGGLLVVHSIAGKFAAASDPFSAMYGARLGYMDILSTLAILYLFAMALRTRRKVHFHARYMIAPVLFLLSPILGRLPPALPFGLPSLERFAVIVQLANGVALLVAAILYVRAPKHGRPFVVAGGVLILQSLGFVTLGRTAAWERLFASLASLPVSAVAGLGIAAGVAAIWTGWAAGSPRPRDLAPA
jgi:hypothetical protein